MNKSSSTDSVFRNRIVCHTVFLDYPDVRRSEHGAADVNLASRVFMLSSNRVGQP